MKNPLQNILNRLTLVGIALFIHAPRALAADTVQGGADAARPTQPGAHAGDPATAATPGSLIDTFGVIANILIFLTGAISVIVIIYSGIRYVTSTGDAARVKAAKDTLVYAIVGLIVAIMAYAIVHFVTTQLLKAK